MKAWKPSCSASFTCSRKRTLVSSPSEQTDTLIDQASIRKSFLRIPLHESSLRRQGPIRRALSIGCGVWVPALRPGRQSIIATAFLTPQLSAQPAHVRNTSPTTSLRCLHVKAILCTRLGGPDDLELVELPMPVAAAGEAVVSIKAVGLNFYDTLIIAGKYQTKPPLPFSPGGEFAGVIDSVGAGTNRKANKAYCALLCVNSPPWRKGDAKVLPKNQHNTALPSPATAPSMRNIRGVIVIDSSVTVRLQPTEPRSGADSRSGGWSAEF